MIGYLTRTLVDASYEQLPLYLEYIRTVKSSEQKLTLRPHGNATKAHTLFTSTIPSVLEKIKVR